MEEVDDQTPRVAFESSQEPENTNRRRIQNRIAQRKHRERLKALRQNSLNGVYDEDITSVEIVQSADQSEPAFDILNDMIYGLNVPDPANEAQMNLPQPNSSIPVLQGQEQQSLRTSSSFGHQNQDGQPLGNRSLTLKRVGKNANISIDGQISSQNLSLHPVEGSEYCPIVEQATVVQSQRARICDQAEQHLQKVISLYEFGVSLDILAADPRLGNSLVIALKRFEIQR
uniref:BZIP domain-containing protein n=2 Tax=Talaromyces marneffei TaxID=37727 RepID=A0A093VIR7_TALMA